MALTTSITAATATTRAVPMSGSSAVEKHTKSASFNWADGVGANQVDQVWSDDRSLPVGTETLDLQALTQLDDDGATLRSGISFDGVKELWIRNTSATGVLVIGAAGANPWDGAGTPFVALGSNSTIAPGGLFHWVAPTAAGGAVGAASNNLLMTASVATVTYEIKIAGIAT